MLKKSKKEFNDFEKKLKMFNNRKMYHKVEKWKNVAKSKKFCKMLQRTKTVEKY